MLGKPLFVRYVYEGVLREDFVLHLSLAKEASRCNALLTNVLPERILDTLKKRQDAVDSMEGVRRDSGLVLSREIGKMGFMRILW